ncbi:unnamed protein product [Tetraodon nigroviridis]|uniref:Chromosome undetermined SCAF17449, whole genome shotgun sequence n=1 Tax=Tetraodon nigroviridis TaxID=99883 RepID=Q4RD34_TETNG|nr:unnamed protein product [Tetraodon nigroviridis]
MMSPSFAPSEHLVFSRPTNGDIYIWSETTLYQNHQGPRRSPLRHVLPGQPRPPPRPPGPCRASPAVPRRPPLSLLKVGLCVLEQGFVTGGKDGVVQLGDEMFHPCLKT